jgi:hypothetical protein
MRVEVLRESRDSLAGDAPQVANLHGDAGSLWTLLIGHLRNEHWKQLYILLWVPAL